MNNFLSCDWGTSTLRISLVNGNTGEVILGEMSDEGMARIFSLWKLTGGADGTRRRAFYLDVLHQHIKSIELKLQVSLKGCRLIISGMASSTIGFIELPYSELPFSLSGDGLQIRHIPAHEGFEYDTSVISGVKSIDDVMRGEETQLIGFTSGSNIINNELFIIPGTHSKHIYVNNNQITSFKTYMTGEFFELLSQKSILANSVEKENAIEKPQYLESFTRGIIDATNFNLLKAAFKVRTNTLLEKYTPKENFNYLSGLLIGTELKDIANIYTGKIHLLCSATLEKYYLIALKELGMANKLQTYPPQQIDKAVVTAHYLINNRMDA